MLSTRLPGPLTVRAVTNVGAPFRRRLPRKVGVGVMGKRSDFSLSLMLCAALVLAIAIGTPVASQESEPSTVAADQNNIFYDYLIGDLGMTLP